jgi:hypothetical protein
VLAEAEPYYHTGGFRADGMARGKALHAPLMAAFERFAETERALRRLVAARREELDRQILAGPARPAVKAVTALRMRAREAVALVDVPMAELASVDVVRLTDALEALTRAHAEAVSAAAAEHPPLDLAQVGKAAVDLEGQLGNVRHRLGGQGWTPAEQVYLADRLTQWMAPGSPGAVVKAHNGFTAALTAFERSHLDLLGPAVELDTILPPPGPQRWE